MTRSALLKQWDAFAQELLLEKAIADRTIMLAVEAREMLEDATEKEVGEIDPAILLQAVRAEARS